MRDIEFRGRKHDSKHWVVGDLNRCVVVGEMYINRIEENLSTTTHRIDPETLGQYTGKKDSYNEKIFEGDIVRTVYNGVEKVFIVVWDNIEFDFKATNGKENYGSDGFRYLGCCEEIEIIGNIYDNPEKIKLVYR